MEKTRKNRLKMVLFIMCLSLVTLTGCKEKEKHVENNSSEKESVTIKKANVKIEDLVNLDEENVVISLDKFDYFFYKETSSVTTISFDIYTMKELKEDDIAVSMKTEIPYTYEVVKQEDEKLEDFNLMSYLGVDWKELYQLMTEETDKFEEVTLDYTEQYESIEEVPVLHAYNVSVQFDLAGQQFELTGQDLETETISEVDVIVDGNTYKINGGSITIDADFILEREREGIEMNTLSYFEVPFDINKEGTTVLPEYSFTTEEDIRIDDFKVLHPDFHIQSVELQIEENGNVSNEKLTNLSGVEISKGAKVTIFATVQSDKLAEAFSYGASGLQIMEYTLMEENTTQTAYSDFVIRTRLRAFDFYGYYVDGIDVLSYYYDYYNPIYGY